MFIRPPSRPAKLPPVLARFGVRGPTQLRRDFRRMLKGMRRGDAFQFDPASLGLFRPDISWPAYAGYMPKDRRAPIFNLFDRTGGGLRYTQRVSRATLRDFRDRKLSYDEHDGVDFVCPIGTPLCAAAPGTVVLVRDNWLRGGLTLGVDHGDGLITQYTHCSQALASLGQAVQRGEPIALSGASGLDMVQFFPMIPPHIHFMVWHNGRPMDPYRRPDEPDGGGTWLNRNDPVPSGPLSDEGIPALSAVDEAAMDAAISACDDPELVELMRSAGTPHYRAALLEDALHHDGLQWGDPHAHRARPLNATASEVRLSLPLPSDYVGARFADAPWT